VEVALFNIDGIVVVIGIIRKMPMGCIIGGQPLRAIDKVVYVKSVEDENAHVYELYMCKIGECLDKIICWPRNNIHNLTRSDSHVPMENSSQLPLSSQRSLGSTSGVGSNDTL